MLKDMTLAYLNDAGEAAAANFAVTSNVMSDGRRVGVAAQPASAHSRQPVQVPVQCSWIPTKGVYKNRVYQLHVKKGRPLVESRYYKNR